jgi:hypothetical protein
MGSRLCLIKLFGLEWGPVSQTEWRGAEDAVSLETVFHSKYSDTMRVFVERGVGRPTSRIEPADDSFCPIWTLSHNEDIPYYRKPQKRLTY